MEEMAELRSILIVLIAFGESHGELTAEEVCVKTGLSRSAVDKCLKVLTSRDLLARGTRFFGRSTRYVLGARGTTALGHLRSLDQLLMGRHDSREFDVIPNGQRRR